MINKVLIVVFGVIAVGALVYLLVRESPSEPLSYIDYEKPLNLDYKKYRAAVKAKTTPFSPAIKKDKHKVVRLTIVNNEIVPPTDTSLVKYRFGKTPGNMSGSGPVKVSFIKKASSPKARDSVVYMYLIQNPLYYRVESGSDPGLRKVVNGAFYLAVPDNKQISLLELEEEGEQILESDISFVHKKP